MTNYVAPALFLAKRSYAIKNENGTSTDYFGYDFLVYDQKEEYGLVKPRVISINKPQSEPIDISGIGILTKVNVVIELFYNSKDGTYKPKYTGIEKITK